MNTADLVISNARIVNATDTVTGHVVITGGVITSVLGPGQEVPQAGRVIDAAGLVLLPGGVDGHCHVEQVTGLYGTVDTYAQTSIAALWGGTTTIMDFGIPRDDTESPLQAAHRKMELAREARCDVALHGAVIHWDSTVPAQLEQLADYGIRSVKMYTTNRGTTMADDETILKVMEQMVRLDGLTYIHAEHDPIIVDCTTRHAQRGRITAADLPVTRPELAEATSVAEVLGMAEYTGAPVYFVHQSIPEAVGLVTGARARGMEVYSETCPHYLALDDSVYASTVPEHYSCCPPLRSRATVDALVAETVAGEVDVISSDHSCYSLEQKRKRADDIRFMPHGLPGVELRLPVAYSTLVRDGDMSLQDFAAAFSTTPARVNGLATKGAIAEGFDADLVLIDPVHTKAVDSTQLHMGTDFSPFEGHELTGWAHTVIAAGKVVLHEGRFTDPGATGRLLPRAGASEARTWTPAVAVPTASTAG